MNTLGTASRAAVLVALAVIWSVGGFAGQGPERPAAERLSAEFRQLDFWVGTWNVALANGGQARNTVSAFGPGGGVAILEDYRIGTYVGTSVSYFSPRDGVWRQLWTNNNGGLLEFAGGLQGNTFEIDGSVGTTLTRIIYHDITERSLVFDYDYSTTNGATWTNDYSGRYSRVGAAREPQPAMRESGRRALPPAARQLDFRRGDWTVEDGSGARTASNVVVFGEGGGIAVLEKATREGGYELGSVAVYHPQLGSWNLLSFDTDGVLMDLKGGMTPSGVVLTGPISDPRTGLDATARMRFDRTSDREVHQIIEVSRDGGQTWEPYATNRYVREALAAPENLRARKVKKSKVVLAWDDAFAHETSFELLRRDGDDWTVIRVLAPDTVTAAIKALDRRTTYVFGIRVCDEFGCSEPSEITVTTR